MQLLNHRLYWLLVPFSLLACSTSEPSPEVLERYVEAKNLYLQGKPEAALPIFLSVREQAPRFDSNTFMIGKICFFREDYEEAEAVWRAILKDNPAHGQSIKWLALLCLLEDRPAEAEELAVTALRDDAEDPELLLLMGRIRMAQEDYGGAIQFYSKALLFEDRLAEARIDLAEIYRRFGLAERAAEELQRALALMDEDAPARDAVAALLAGLGGGDS